MPTDRPRASALDDRIDELYRLPLADFTAARNALAKTLTGAEAQGVKRLAKPTLIPWAINQVYWTARSVYDRLLAAGGEVRRAQIAALEKPGATPARVQKSRDQVRDAIEAHRRAVADAVHQALRAASRSDAHPAVDALTRMFEALSLSPEHPADPGRLTELVQPAGFEALTGVTPALTLGLAAARETPAGSTPPPPTASRRGATPETPPQEAARLPASARREAAAAEKARRQALEEARAAAVQARTQAREAERRARTTSDRAEAAVRQAEEAVTAAREARDLAQRALEDAVRAREAAEARAKELAAG